GRNAVAQRLYADAGLVEQLARFARAVTRQRVEGRPAPLLGDVERRTVTGAGQELLPEREILELHALRHALARVGQAEIRTQIAPWTRAIGAQITGFATLGAALDRDRVHAVGIVIGVVEDAADAPAVTGLPK